VVTVWLAIDPSTAENGAMQVIPRALYGNLEHEAVDPDTNVLSWEAKRKPFEEADAVTIELDRNHASLHDARLLHGSPPNTSNMRRCGYTMRYMPTTVKLSPESYATHNIYLARGKDRAGNQYGDPTKTYEEMARFRKKSGTGH
jgi:ectoine hydroxylase-related dioxygenase (phytanoyl-CoA dioxygenase family)